LLRLASDWGLPSPYLSIQPVRSYRTIAPLPAMPRRTPVGGMFLWHFPRDRSHWTLSSSLAFLEARTFLEKENLFRNHRPSFPSCHLTAPANPPVGNFVGNPTRDRHIYAKERSLQVNFAAIIRGNCLSLNRRLRNIFGVATSLTVYLLLTVTGRLFLKHLFPLPQPLFPAQPVLFRRIFSGKAWVGVPPDLDGGNAAEVFGLCAAGVGKRRQNRAG